MPSSPCLVTVHGIGFQQPPHEGEPGYADALHEHLGDQLGGRLGDDPERVKKGERGPVYVSSQVGGSRERGLARLDPGRPLAPAGKIAHVALVYSPSEPLKPRLGSVADTLIRAILEHDRYVSALGGIRVAIEDGWAALHEKDAATKSANTTKSTLRPRAGLEPAVHHRLLGRLLHKKQPSPPPEPGLLGIFRALEDDMATYVARNDLRERVRGFVAEALLATVTRSDVSKLVLNTHSQGTMIGWDVLCRTPFESWLSKEAPGRLALSDFVTAGSPIRKYVDLFAWGDQVGQMRRALQDGLTWTNFWDEHDPVADPLNPAAAWRPREPVQETPPRDIGLLRQTDPKDGRESHVEIGDVEVDNVEHSSGGGLQAHDYWNNVEEFVRPLAGILERAL
ncbi:MAG TPA: hypothetical protein VMB05_10520 [Solirubrobacteraceae bacterium]|nr:hypothetical protein [Solirubrobacteraceae bacterium]